MVAPCKDRAIEERTMELVLSISSAHTRVTVLVAGDVCFIVIEKLY